MKTVATLLAVLLPSLALAASGEVSFLEGTASRSPKAGGKVALSLKGAVEQGDLVETGPNSRLELALPDKSVVRLGPSSKLRLDEAAFAEDSRSFKATLVLGKAWAKVSSLFGSEKNFEVKTERAVAGVRGTIFRVDTDQSKAVLVRVYAGAVAVAGNNPIPMAQPNKGERKQIAGPQLVSQSQWEKVVGAMMQVKVSAKGEPSEPTKFSEAEESKDTWATWNKARDNG